MKGLIRLNPTTATFSIVETVRYRTDTYTATTTFSGVSTGDSETLTFGGVITFAQVFEEFAIISIAGICGSTCCKLLNYNSCPVSCTFTIGDNYTYTVTLTLVPDSDDNTTINDNNVNVTVS